MSYCRNNGKNSDVYVIATICPKSGKDGWECCGCKRTPKEDCVLGNFTIPGTCFFSSRQKRIKHLEWHLLAGDKVPQRAFDRLRREIIENDAE